jgi:hypothetical protein
MAIKSLSIRIDEKMLNKLHVVADYEGRSANSQILILIRDAIEKYEEKLGFCKILDENGEIFSAYSTLTENFLTEEEKKGNKEAELLNRELKEIRKRFGEDNADLE